MVPNPTPLRSKSGKRAVPRAALLAPVFLAALQTSAWCATLAVWNFDDAVPANRRNASSVSGGLTASPVSPVNLTIPNPEYIIENPPTNTEFGWELRGATTAVSPDLTKYVQIQCTTQNFLDLHLIFENRRNVNGAKNLEIRTSADGFAAAVATIVVPSSYQTSNVDLSALNALENQGAPITIRIYPYNAVSSTNGNIRLDNITLTGTPPDVVPPTVLSVNRQTPASSPTNAANVTWRVTFSENVQAATVNIADFTLTPTAGALNTAAVTGVTQIDGDEYDVTASTGTAGNRTLRLDVLPAATVLDAYDNDYNATFNTGQTYVIDTVNPVINTCASAGNASADGNCQAAVPAFTPASVTEASSYNVTQSPTVGTLVGLGATPVTITVTDAAGNTATCSTSFTVSDTTPPSLTCPSDSGASADSNCQAAVPDYAASATSSDNCSGVTVTQSPTAGTLVGLGPHVVTLTSTDAATNSTTCTATFTVSDTTPPTANAVGSQSANADEDCQLPVPDFTIGLGAADNCDSELSIVQVPAAGTLVGAGVTNVTITITDDADNSIQRTPTFTVNDLDAPIISICASNADIEADANCVGTIPDVTGSIEASDNCDGDLQITQSPTAGTGGQPLGPVVVTITVADDAGNTATCSATLTVKDVTGPNISDCGIDQSYTGDDACDVTIPDFTSAVVATDNCPGSVTITQSPEAGSQIEGPDTLVTITATDAAGNTSTCERHFYLNDTNAPTLACDGLYRISGSPTSLDPVVFGIEFSEQVVNVEENICIDTVCGYDYYELEPCHGPAASYILKVYGVYDSGPVTVSLDNCDYYKCTDCGPEPIEDCAGNDFDASDISASTNYIDVSNAYPDGIRIIPGDGKNNDQFATSVSIDSETILVGAPNDDGFAPDATSPDNAGAAYFYERELTCNDPLPARGYTYCEDQTSTFTQLVKVVASNPAATDLFGSAVDVFGDWAVVGAPYADQPGKYSTGRAYIFRKDDGTWIQHQILESTPTRQDARFGNAVAIQGRTLFVAASFDRTPVGLIRSGVVYAFEFNSCNQLWEQTQVLLPSDPSSSQQFGSSLDVDGRTLVVGSLADNDRGSNTGSAYVFEEEGGLWSQTAKLLPDDAAGADRCGWSVAVLGNLIAVGSPSAKVLGSTSATRIGLVTMYSRTFLGWEELGPIQLSSYSVGGNDFGAAVELAAFPYYYDDRARGGYGYDEDAAVLLVGAPNRLQPGAASAGEVYAFFVSTCFENYAGAQNAFDYVPGARYGKSIAASGGTIVIGAPEGANDSVVPGVNNSANKSGSAYIYPFFYYGPTK